MDDVRPIAHRSGGTLEPTDRDAVLKAQLRVPDATAGMRFELRDPFAEVTYHASSFDEMVSKADRIGALRFVSIGPDGTRATVAKEQGHWRKPASGQTHSRSDERVDPEPALARPAKGLPREAVSLQPSEAKAKADLGSERLARLEAELKERYVIRHAPLRIGDVTIGQTEYRHRGDTSRVAFTESTFRLSTETNSPAIARSMVDVAEARHWKAIRVSGSDDFRRLVWLEASMRDIRVVGYEPTQGDRDKLISAEASRQGRHEHFSRDGPSSAGNAKQSSRGGGRKAVLAALDAVLVAKRIPAKQRVAVMAAAEQSLARRARHGESFRIKVYDPAARSDRTPSPPQQTNQRNRERGSPAR